MTMEEEYKKIIKGLEQSFQYIQRRSNQTASPKATAMNNIRKAIDYITKRETPAQIELEGGGSTWWYVCEECHGAVDDSDSYCKHCGRPLKN